MKTNAVLSFFVKLNFFTKKELRIDGKSILTVDMLNRLMLALIEVTNVLNYRLKK